MDYLNGYGNGMNSYGMYGYMSPAFQIERQHYLERMEAVQRQAARAHKGDSSVLMGEYHGEGHGAVKSAGYIAANLFTGAIKGGLNLVKGMFTDDQGHFSLAQTALTLVSFTAMGGAFRLLSATPKLLQVAKMALGGAGLMATLPNTIQDSIRVASHYFHGNYEAAEEAANDLGQDLPGTALAATAFRSGMKGFKVETGEKNLVDAFKSWAGEKEGGSAAAQDFATIKKPFINAKAKFVKDNPAPQSTPKAEAPAKPEATPAVDPANPTPAETVQQVANKAGDAAKQAVDYAHQKAHDFEANWAGVKAYKPGWTDATEVFKGTKSYTGFAKAAGETQIPLMMAKSERSLDELGHGGGEAFYPGMGMPMMPQSGFQMGGSNSTGFNIPTVIDLSTGQGIVESESHGH